MNFIEVVSNKKPILINFDNVLYIEVLEKGSKVFFNIAPGIDGNRHIQSLTIDNYFEEIKARILNH